MDDRALWSRIEGIFHSALERKRAERADYVRTACEGDEDLRLRVESLLAHDDSGSSLGALTGHRLGPYEILAPLGAGGMGEIYRARDTRLDRTVAVKILRRHLLSNPQLLERFKREAQVIARLSHPHICTLHDVGHQDGIDFLVMELVDGESLRALLHRGQVPIRKAIDIAVQIADGMAAAHTAGITHRDLKPENVMVTKVGRVKILDFGLARQMATEQGPPTIHDTQPGTVVGTVNYMSPEQASGLPVDYRSDQFAFGLMLYELVSGKRAFQRESKAQTLAAIISEEPLPIEARLPPPLRWMIDRCLAKEPAQRYESSRDLYQDLRALYEHLSEAYTDAVIEPVKTTRGGFWKSIAIPACLLLAATIALFMRRDVGQDIARYRYTPVAMSTGRQNWWPFWAPDGKSVAYLATGSGREQVFVRSLNAPAATQLTATRESPELIGWSPDSNRVLFIAPGPDATDVKPTRALYSIAVVGGEPELVTPIPDNTYAVELTRDNQTIAIFGCEKSGKVNILISSPVGSPYRQYEPAPFKSSVFVNGPPLLRFAPNGKKLLLIRAGDSMTEEAWLLPYPPSKVIPRRVLTHFPARKQTLDVRWMPDSRHVVIALSFTGRPQGSHLWIADTESDDSYQITGGNASEDTVAISPDGRQVIYSEGRLDLDLTSISLVDGQTKKLIASEGLERMAAWSANTEKLAYVTDRNGATEIWMRSADGSDQPLVTQADFPDSPTRCLMNPVLSPDGKRVIFTRILDDGTIRTWIKSLSGGGAPARLNESAVYNEFAGTWSPDGRRIVELAFSGTSGPKVSLALVKVGSSDKPITLRDGTYDGLPDWSPTGEWITFRDKGGWNLISPDGKKIKPLGNIHTEYLVFSKDGKLLYGIRLENDKSTFFSLNISTLKVKNIRELGTVPDLAPVSDQHPGIRLSVAPDGNSIAYTTGVWKSNLWILEGFRQPSLLSRLGLN